MSDDFVPPSPVFVEDSVNPEFNPPPADNQPPATPEDFDTPTQRATINMLDVDLLDDMLDGIRERRLQAVRRLEDAAKVKADDVRLEAFLKFQSQYKRAKNAMAKLEDAIVKAEAQVHKARLLAMAAEMEVHTEDEDADDAIYQEGSC